MKGVRLVPYRLPEVLEAIARGERVWIAEGEKDVDALWNAGAAATCNTAGAGKWKETDTAAIRGVTEVTIVADKDQAGYKHADDVRRALEVNGVAAWRGLQLQGFGLQALHALLQQAGFNATLSPQIQKDIWYKLWGNMTVNPVSALTGATTDRILDDDLVRGFISNVMREAKAIGERLFMNNCAQCHGSDARGSKGFPNLTDADWLHGGTPDKIKETLVQGRIGVALQGFSIKAIGGIQGNTQAGTDIDTVATQFERLGQRINQALAKNKERLSNRLADSVRPEIA